MNGAELIKWVQEGGMDEECSLLGGESYREYLIACIDGHCDRYGEKNELELYCAPGRTEIGGSYIDIQNGCAIAAAITLDVTAAASRNTQNVVRISRKGQNTDLVDLCDLRPKERERGRIPSLIRGVAAKMKKMGYPIAGFDAYTLSRIPSGMELGSTAAFTVLIADIFNHLFCDGALSPIEIAMIARYADREYFGRETTLMEQTVCAAGDCVEIDFANPLDPAGSRMDFDLEKSGYQIAIVRCGSDHAYLEEERASVPADMRTVAHFLGRQVLREASEEEFYAALPSLRRSAGDRAVLRAAYFYGENRRVEEMKTAIEKNNLNAFFELVNESGRASFELLQNRSEPSILRAQSLTVGLCLARKIIGGEGGCRIYGAVSSGTIQAYLKQELRTEFQRRMHEVFGEGSCIFLNIRKPGCIRLH